MIPTETLLTVMGMSCGGCEKAVERALLSLKGVTSVQADHLKQRVTVHHDPQQVSPDQLRQTIQKAGYQTP